VPVTTTAAAAVTNVSTSNRTTAINTQNNNGSVNQRNSQTTKNSSTKIFDFSSFSKNSGGTNGSNIRGSVS
jgi:hypothetical protein